MRSERHKTSMTSITYEETSLIDPSVIMIFLVLPISTHDYCNRGMKQECYSRSTLENPQTWFPYVDAEAEHQLPHDDSCNLMLYQCRH